MKRLTSRHHPLVAAYRAVARGRGPEDQILLDGPHLVQEACRSGLDIESAVAEPLFLSTPEGRAILEALRGAEVVEASPAIMEAVSPVAAPAGIVALARRPRPTPQEVFDHPPQLVVIGVDVQDPGNVGAIARAAEAGGATGLVLCGASADPFGWKALRGSMGSLLRLPTMSGVSWADAVSAARAAGLRVVAAAPRASTGLYEIDACGPIAFLLGGEGPGLPADAIAAADLALSIPMRPPVESLNVAVAGGVLVYEAARQRMGLRVNRLVERDSLP